jgi:hypothetical protein
MDDEQRQRTGRAGDPGTEKAIRRIEELAARCEAAEASNIYLAAQLAEVNGAWRDAIAAIAAADAELASACAASLIDLAAQSTGTRQQIFTGMVQILEKAGGAG